MKVDKKTTKSNTSDGFYKGVLLKISLFFL